MTQLYMTVSKITHLASKVIGIDVPEIESIIYLDIINRTFMSIVDDNTHSTCMIVD